MSGVSPFDAPPSRCHLRGVTFDAPPSSGPQVRVPLAARPWALRAVGAQGRGHHAESQSRGGLPAGAAGAAGAADGDCQARRLPRRSAQRSARYAGRHPPTPNQDPTGTSPTAPIHSARIRLLGIDAPELGACGDPGIRDLMTTVLSTFWIVIVGQQEVGRRERVEIGSSFLLVSTFFLLVSILCGQIGSVQDRSPTCPRAFIHSFRTGVPLVGCGVYGGAQ